MSVAAPVTRARSRVEWVDIVKGIAIVGVVIYHAGLFLTPVGLAQPWQADATRLLALSGSLPLFFLASGLFGQRILVESFAELFRRRLAPLLYLYVLWSLFRFAIFQLVPWVLPTSDPSDWREPAGMLIRPNGGLWFVYALVLYSLAVWAFRTLPPAVPLAGSAVVSVLFTSELLRTGVTGWDKMGANVFWFVAAVHLGPEIQSRASRLAWRSAVVSVAVFSVICAALVTNVLPAERLVKVGLAPLAIVAGVSLSVTLSRTVAARPLRQLGGHTLVIYLVHYFPVAIACGLLLGRPGLLATLAPATVLLPVALTIAAIAISLLVWRCLEHVPGIFALPRRPRAASRQPASTTRA